MNNNQDREQVRKKNNYMQRKPLKKLHLLMANEKKLRQMCRKMSDPQLRNRLRMVSITQSYDLTSSPQFEKARLMLNALDAEAY